MRKPKHVSHEWNRTLSVSHYYKHSNWYLDTKKSLPKCLLQFSSKFNRIQISPFFTRTTPLYMQILYQSEKSRKAQHLVGLYEARRFVSVTTVSDAIFQVKEQNSQTDKTRRPANWWISAKRDVIHPTVTVVYNACFHLFRKRSCITVCRLVLANWPRQQDDTSRLCNS